MQYIQNDQIFYIKWHLHIFVYLSILLLLPKTCILYGYKISITSTIGSPSQSICLTIHHSPSHISHYKLTFCFLNILVYKMYTSYTKPVIIIQYNIYMVKILYILSNTISTFFYYLLLDGSKSLRRRL